MKIITLKELCNMPNGTVFVEYEPDMFVGDIQILCGRYYDNYFKEETFNGVVNLLPQFSWSSHGNYKSERITTWSTLDTAACDFDQDQLFAVFDINEVKAMINCLRMAIGEDCDDLNGDSYFYQNKILSEKEAAELTDGRGLWRG